MKEKEKNNIFLKVLLIIFIIYFALYLMENLGYYNISSKNKILTDEAIKKFELDIKEGNNIDLKKYIDNNANYSNSYSNLGYKISTSIDSILNKGLKYTGNFLKKIFSKKD